MNPSTPSRVKVDDQSSIAKLRCYSPEDPYIPENRFSTPDGFRDEIYLVPFNIQIPVDGTLVRNVPIVMDDDVPFYWRSIIFPMAGLTKQSMASFPDSGIPCGLLFRDTRGNAMQGSVFGQVNNPVLTAGAWCQSGYGFNGGGFPLDAEVECDPGGVVLVDVLPPTGAGDAGFATLTATGLAESITFTAVAPGTAGNSIQVHGASSAPLGPLVISVVGTVITITLATDAGGDSISTFADVRAAIIASAPASALVNVSISGPNPAEIMQPNLFGERGSFLHGGGQSATLTGYLVGVKRYPKCVDGQ